MLELAGVSCINDGMVLFERISMTIPNATHVYLRGENGTGKTSLLKTIALLRPIELGKIIWDGAWVKEIKIKYKSSLQYVGHKQFFIPELSCIDNLFYVLSLYGELTTRESIQRILEISGMIEFSDTPFIMLSAGCKQKLSLAQLFLRENLKLWLLDEPFINLDANSSNWFNSAQSDFVSKGGIIIESTHTKRAFEGQQIILTKSHEVVTDD
ncbi:MAG: heme ABC exporter ATP-binding protein CcmA [Francisellaceae bacterium]|jgi:heme exporter protein A|nr:heme ABC exporter ATP-binding protein CcmA [Francisellaceae bacterium]MBT6207428.1 heme ABC exporter ATP-binding protein CcmA [Francisellaceae bacterium]MBT6537991.1 heme ABC exporter ATP-binding protein CcmA [Francisellaceae bacterium]